MVVAMTKYSFLIYHKEYDAFLTQLRELGMLHVIEKQNGTPEEGSELQTRLQDATRFERNLKEMARILGEDFTACAPVDPHDDAIGKVAAFENYQEEKAKLIQKQAHLQKEIERMAIWGNFDWERIYSLRDAGYIIRFYTVAERNFREEWVDEYNAIPIFSDSSLVYFITITPSGKVVEFEDAERVRLPKETLHELQVAQQEAKDDESELNKEVIAFCKEWYNTIEAEYHHLQEAVDYTKVILNSESQADNKLILLEGWVPTQNEPKINAFLESEGIYYLSQRATKEDPAPVKLTNNRFARLFHPITELYEMPSYGEMDLTPFFAPFFVMFFGLCLGDAGYGLILLLVGLIARRRVKPSLKPIMTLVAILGAGTVVFGTVSGTLFGIELLKVDWPWITKLKTIMLNPDQLFTFSLIVGAFQIIFGMVLKAVGQTVRFGFKNALSAWGWLIAIVGCGGTFALQHFGFLPASTARILYYVTGGIGALGIFVFNDMKRHPLINVGAGLWDSYNMATGLLGDVLSYVRLFALGISGAVLGLVFNDLAIKMSPDIPVVGFLVSAVILIFGHSMNLFMAGLGAFVHPMRLTFVEFYKNAGFEGGGKKYNPFARKTKEEK
ncbi:MAG: V-type ATPase 116kDa subunit family protein [Bacteroidales bacterium]